MEEPKKDESSEPEANSLEDQTTVVESQSGQSDSDLKDATKPGATNTTNSTAPPKRRGVKDRLAHQNIYLLLFITVALIAGVTSVAIYLHGKQTNNAGDGLKSQTLSASSLSQLANSDVTVGDPKQLLTVQSNAIFSGKVLVRGDLEIAGKLNVGSSLSITGISVSGNSQFEDVQVSKDIAITGSAGIQGNLTVKSIAVNGAGTFSGTVTAPQIVANSLQLNNNLTLTKHIVAGGATPGRSNGTALGGGGTTSVSGSDTAGSITVNTGSGPAVGCFINITFAQKYNATPHVIVTPVGSAASQVNYYVNRSATGFSVCGTTAAPASQTFGFDYIIIE